MTGTLEATETVQTIQGIEVTWLGPEAWVTSLKDLLVLRSTQIMRANLCCPTEKGVSPGETEERYCIRAGKAYYEHQVFENEEWN